MLLKILPSLFTLSIQQISILGSRILETHLQYIAELTDVLSINENEYNSLAQVAGLEHLELTSENIVDDVKNAVKQLAEKIGISVDLHTRKGAAWSNGREDDLCPCNQS